MLVALGLGVGLQRWATSPSDSASDPLLEALIHQPKAEKPTGQRPGAQAQTQSQAKGLEGIQAHRAAPVASGAPQRFALAEPAQAPPLALEIRVALLSAGLSPSLGATGPWQLRGPSGAVLGEGGAGDPVPFGLARQWGEAWLSTGPQHALLVNGVPYDGSLRLVPKDGGIQLVNHLSLERYIAAVVGSEMPSGWPMEALRAQAVAARSYALAHMARPASRHWHLGDTTRWQAYKGMARLNSRTQQAATSTAGMILSYQGGIVESLYAANRQISLEAHGHLGASMSQHGARELAEQGFPYNAILGRYYQGASLARLRSGAS